MMLSKRNIETINTYNQHADGYAARFMEMDLYHEAYDLFCQLIEKENANVFEIACGPGNVSKYLLTKRPDLNLFGIDLAPNMVKLASQYNPSARFEVLDCRNIDKLKEKYDAIMCGFVMPYLTQKECEQLIEDAAKLLNNNGIFYFSTMEGNTSGFETTSFSGKDRVYIYYHQAHYLQDYCAQRGLKIVDFRRVKCPEPDGRILTDMIFTVRKA